MLGALGMLVGGLLVLAVAADQFVIGAARSARHLRVPLVAVGVVVVGFGTSLPELVVSALAAGRGEIAVGVGNVIGSNLANLTLLLGVAALLSPLAVTSGVVRRELPLVAATTLLLAVVVQGRLAAWEGTLLLATMLLTTAWLLRSALRGRDDVVADETDEFLAPPSGRGAEAARTVLGLLGTLAGSQIVLAGALDVAERLDLAAGFVGATLVAVGTSLPELVTVVQSARRGEPDLIVGNLLGSNVFNALLVTGVVAVVADAPVGDARLTGVGVVAMVVATALASAALLSARRLDRPEGALLVVTWVVSVVLL